VVDVDNVDVEDYGDVFNSENDTEHPVEEGNDVNAPTADQNNQIGDNGNNQSFFATKYKCFVRASLCNVAAVVVCIIVSVSLPWFADNTQTLYSWTSGYIAFLIIPVVIHLGAVLTLFPRSPLLITFSCVLCGFLAIFGGGMMGLELLLLSTPPSMLEHESSEEVRKAGFHRMAGFYFALAAVVLSMVGTPLYLFTILYVLPRRPMLENNNNNNNTTNLEIVVDNSNDAAAALETFEEKYNEEDEKQAEEDAPTAGASAM